MSVLLRVTTAASGIRRRCLQLIRSARLRVLGYNQSRAGVAVDGWALVGPRPPYQCQFADRDRVDEFLNSPSTLASDAHWQEFGFENVDEYAIWAPRICAVACLRMALLVFEVAPKSVAEITKDVAAAGGYVLRDHDGELVDRGWYYQPVIDYAVASGLQGEVIGTLTVDGVCSEVARGHLVVASVNPVVIRGDVDVLPKGASRGGHLVLVYGVRVDGGKVTELRIHNPSGRTRSFQEDVVVSRERFDEAFAGRGFTLHRGTAASAN